MRVPSLSDLFPPKLRAVPHPREDLGKRLRARRLELRLSQNDVAGRLPGRVDLNQVSRWERGIHQPSDATLEHLASVLDVDLDYLVEAKYVPPAPRTQMDRIEWMLQRICEKTGIDYAAEFERAAAPTLEVFEGDGQATEGTAPPDAQPQTGTPAPGRKSRARGRS